MELDPEYGRAYAYLAWARFWNWTSGWGEGPENTAQRTLELARKAVELDDTDYYNHWMLGRIYQGQSKFDEADAEYQRAAALNPNEPDIATFIAWGQSLRGHHDEAVRMMLAAMRGNPFYPSWYAGLLGRFYYNAKDYEKAIAAAKDASGLNPTGFNPHVVMAASYAQLGQQEEALAEAAIVLEKNPKFTITSYPPQRSALVEAAVEHWREGLLKTGLPMGPQPTN